jgi:ornithine cyclodeaminase/alanine dehydrogenase-like protein (mu-crystallin family)
MTEIVVLSQSELRGLVNFADYIEAVADAFRMLAEGGRQSPVSMEFREDHGTFHIKAGSLPRGAGYGGSKDERQLTLKQLAASPTSKRSWPPSSGPTCADAVRKP